MSGSGPLGENDPFSNLPGFLGDLARMLQSQSQGGVSWEAARQFAVQVAAGGGSEANVDPIERIRFEELARVAELRVGDATGYTTSVSGRPVTVLPVSRAEWARRTLDAWRPMLERLAGALGAAPQLPGDPVDPAEAADPMASMLSGIFAMIGPPMASMQVGAMVGHLATRALGQYDLPLPRPPSDELIVVGANLDAFAEEWSLPGDDLRLWVCLSELTTHTVLGRPHVRSRLADLVGRYAGAFRVDPTALEGHLAGLDPTNPSALPDVLNDPEVLLGAIRTPEQRELLPQLEALIAAIVGYVDHIMDFVGTNLIGSYGMLTEALHRRRVEAGQGDRMVEQLLGLELGRAQYERGAAFVDGIVERAGPEGPHRLWHSAHELPTPAEVDAPGLWLARIDLPT